MNDRFRLSKEENIFLAKKRWPDSIYCGMRMENRNVTFPQTLTILEGINVSEVTISDIQAILNMRDAWQLLINTIDKRLDITYLCEIQAKVAYREALVWGELRTGTIGISGVSYIPPVPESLVVEAELEELLEAQGSATQKALEVFCWTARRQLFWDGNKRTAMLAANKLLISSGAGVLFVTEQDILEFSVLLSAYYESGDPGALKDFLYTKAIFGMESATHAIVAGQMSNQTSSQTNNQTSSQTNNQTSSQSNSRKAINPRTAVWLKSERQRHGYTQRTLAEAIGVATNTIANIEQGQRKGSVDVWQRIERLLCKSEQAEASTFVF